MRTPWTGCGTALVTPFTREGAVDEAGVRRLARRQIDAGIHFLVPCGTTGESPTLTEDERVRVVQLVVEEAAGRVPVLAGAGGYDTKEVIHSARRMKQAGAGGILSVTPYYNKPTPEGLFQHYSAIAGEVGLPIVVYNVPGRTGCNVDVATLVRLSGVPGIVAVKEASGNITQMVEICGAVPKDFLVLSGDDALTLPLMAVGGHGLISVAGQRGAGRDGAHGRARRAGRLCRRAADPQPAAAAHAGELHRVESHSGQERDGRARAARRGVPPADGAAARGVAGANPAGARRAEDRRGARGRPFMTLAAEVEALSAAGPATDRQAAREAFARLRAQLSSGEVRAAEPDPSTETGWRVNTWVKQGILLGFKFGDIADMSSDHGRWPFFDKDTLPLKPLDVQSGVRVVPGGSTVRDGAYLGRGVICMPPMYINIGAWVGEGTLVDSHALVGSCAQIGSRVHLSAAAQIGGVLEPVGALPVIIEDDVLVGGNCGVYEGAVVKRRAVLASGVILTRSTPIYDLPNERIIEPAPGQPLVVPEGAVVVPGSRPVTSGKGREWGLSVATPIIVKYRDERTDARTALEQWIR